MDDDMYQLEVGKSDREAFVLCLALGTLEAMRRGYWPLTAGIWTLGRRIFWEALVDIDDEVLAVFQSADEMSALAKLAGYPAAEAELDHMIAVIRARLSVLPEKSWYARWSDGFDIRETVSKQEHGDEPPCFKSATSRLRGQKIYLKFVFAREGGRLPC